MRINDYSKMGTNAHISVSYMLGSGLVGTIATVECPVCKRGALYREGRTYKVYVHKEVEADVWENVTEEDEVCLVDKRKQ